MFNFNEDIIIQVVLVCYVGMFNEWLCQIMISLVQYLYVFVCEV